MSEDGAEETMEDHLSDDPFLGRPIWSVDCPYCERSESFDDELTARAWATGHIHEEHPDELPPFEGVRSDE